MRIACSTMRHVYGYRIQKKLWQKFLRVKFSLHLIFVGQATHEICLPQKFDTTNLGGVVAEHEKKLCICGYHVYRDIWKATVAAALQLYKHYCV